MFDSSETPPYCDPYGLFRQLVTLRADALCEILVKKLIRRCQRRKPQINDGLGFRNQWDDTCIALITDHSRRETYIDHLVAELTVIVETIPKIDQQTLWLMTYEGADYAVSPMWRHPLEYESLGLPLDTEPDKPWPSRGPEFWPVNQRRIAREIVSDRVLNECVNYENVHIRAYMGW